MAQSVTYGIGGYCENCDPSHPHPLNNLISIEEVPDPIESPDTQVIAEALAQLPEDTLNALKQALGL